MPAPDARGNLIGNFTGDPYKDHRICMGNDPLVAGALTINTGFSTVVSAMGTSRTANAVNVSGVSGGDVSFAGTGTDVFDYIIIGK